MIEALRRYHMENARCSYAAIPIKSHAFPFIHGQNGPKQHAMFLLTACELLTSVKLIRENRGEGGGGQSKQAKQLLCRLHLKSEQI
jgi:hypothetical protein